VHNFNSIISLTADASATTTTSTTLITQQTFFVCTIVSLILGAVIAFSFSIKQKQSKSFLMTVALLPVIVQVVIMLVNGNLGTGIAVMGAFSLVRFRSIPGTARDICAIFLAMAVGLATGTDYLALAAVFTVVVCAICIIYTLSPFGEEKTTEKLLTVIIPESLDYTEVFDDLFDKFTKTHELESVKTTNMGSLFKLKYRIALKAGANEKEFIDELRCRNGNLEIMFSKAMTSDVEKL
jgi:hypothetical protein